MLSMVNAQRRNSTKTEDRTPENSNSSTDELDYYCSIISTFQLVEAINGLHRSQRKSYRKLIEVEYNIRKNIFSTFVSTGSLVITGIGIVLALLRVSRGTFISIIAFLIIFFVILSIHLSIQHLKLREEEREEKTSDAYFRSVDDLWEYGTEYHLLKNVKKRLELARKENVIKEEFFNEKLPRVNDLIKDILTKMLDRIGDIIKSIEKMERNPEKYPNIPRKIDKVIYEMRREELQKDLDKIKNEGNQDGKQERGE